MIKKQTISVRIDHTADSQESQKKLSELDKKTKSFIDSVETQPNSSILKTQGPFSYVDAQARVVSKTVKWQKN